MCLVVSDDCGTPPAVDKATVQADPPTLETNITTYTADSGYVFTDNTGTGSRECLDGGWEELEPPKSKNFKLFYIGFCKSQLKGNDG